MVYKDEIRQLYLKLMLSRVINSQSQNNNIR
jgi:hypothetical protein